MAKLRSVNTHFWQDGFVSNLTPEQKLFFLYLLTAPASNVAGVYEVTVRQIAFDTGLTVQQVQQFIKVLTQAGKLVYVSDYVILVNHHKNQKLNPSMELARVAIVKMLPAAVREAYDRCLTGCIQPVTSLPEPCTKDKDESKVKDEAPKAPATLQQRTEAFHADIFTMENVQKYSKPMLQAFYQYWCEPNRSGSKMRCELQPTWKLAGRLATWASREVASKKQAESRIYRE